MENGLVEKVLITKSIPEHYQLVKYLYISSKPATINKYAPKSDKIY